MALKSYITKAEHDALPAHFKSEYKAHESGGMVLDVSPANGFTLENTEDLRNALQGERANIKALKKKIEGIPEDLDIAAALKAMERVKDMESWTPEDKVKKQLEDRTRQIEEKYAPQLKAKDDEIGTLTKAVHQFLVTSAAQSAISKHGGVADLLLPHVERQIKVVRDPKGNFEVRVVNAEGNEVVTRRQGQSGMMTIEELVEGMKSSPTYSRAFDGNVLPGGGTPGGGKPGAGGNGSTITISEADARDPGRYRAARAEAEKAGRQLVIG